MSDRPLSGRSLHYALSTKCRVGYAFIARKGREWQKIAKAIDMCVAFVFVATVCERLRADEKASR